jgi:hypothetical protein
MPYLTIGSTNVSVEENAGGTPDVVGEALRTFSGNLRNTRRLQKRSWTFKTIALDSPTGTALETLIGAGVILVCTGDALRGQSINCLVTVDVPKNTSLGTTAADGNNFQWQYNIQLQEV